MKPQRTFESGENRKGQSIETDGLAFPNGTTT